MTSLSERLRRFGRASWVALATLGVAAVAAGAVAAGGGGGPTTTPVSGTFTAAPVKVEQRTCVGTDATYLELHAVFEGTSVSADPRFNGRFQVIAEAAIINTTTGYGTDHGRVTWWDASGRRTVWGSFHDVIKGNTATGMHIAHVVAAPGLPGGELLSNFQVTFDAQFNLTGEFGGAGNSQTPAVVHSGQCFDQEHGSHDGAND